MIVAPHPAGQIVFRQMTHGAMAAEMTDPWGNERFGELASRQAIREAERLHDSGWDRLDDAPRLDRRTGLPQMFRNVPRAHYLEAHHEAVRDCADDSPYVALLISLHFAGMYGRPGAAARWRPHARRVLRFLADSARMQRDLRTRVDIDDAEIARSARLTRVIDGISIQLLSGIASDVRRDVPAAGATREDIVIESLGDRRFSLDPWPFAPDRVALDVPGRLLTRRYDDEAEMRAALDEAPEIIERYELRPR